MQRKPSYYFRKSVTAAIAAGAGLAIGMQIEANEAAVPRTPQPHLAAQGRAPDAFTPLAMPSLMTSDPTHRVDAARECEDGIDADCLYL